MRSAIVNLAPTGMIPTRIMTPHVPITEQEIVADVRRCVEMGANMLHLHARDEAGRPTYKKEIYARLIGAVRNLYPEIVICVSLSGRDFGAFEERSDPLNLTGDLKPDMGSLTLGSMNFSQSASVNSPDMIMRLAEKMADTGIKPELEVFDTGMLNYARYLLSKGLIKPPLYFNFILGNIATAQATPAHLGQLMNDMPPDSLWTGGGVGSVQLSMNAAGLLYGNGVRIGLEDYLWLDSGRKKLATNLEMVQRVVSMCNIFDIPLATPAEVRSMLGL